MLVLWREGVGKLEKVRHTGTVVSARKMVSEMQVPLSNARRRFCDRSTQCGLFKPQLRKYYVKQIPFVDLMEKIIRKEKIAKEMNSKNV